VPGVVVPEIAVTSGNGDHPTRVAPGGGHDGLVKTLDRLNLHHLPEIPQLHGEVTLGVVHRRTQVEHTANMDEREEKKRKKKECSPGASEQQIRHSGIELEEINLLLVTGQVALGGLHVGRQLPIGLHPDLHNAVPSAGRQNPRVKRVKVKINHLLRPSYTQKNEVTTFNMWSYGGRGRIRLKRGWWNGWSHY